MNVTKWAKISGTVLTLVGILGFVPGITSNGMLLGIFSVDAMHNIIHLATGIVGLLVAKKGDMAARKYFKVFGVIYLLVLVLGFAMGGTVFGMMMNPADHILHLVIAGLFLWLGFKGGRSMAMPSAPQM